MYNQTNMQPSNYSPVANQNPAFGYSSQPQGLMVVFVDGEAGANNYPVAAGGTVMLIDFSVGKFWIKSRDSYGMPNQTRTFDFKEVVQKTPERDSVSREEFNSLSSKLEQLLKELGGK